MDETVAGHGLYKPGPGKNDSRGSKAHDKRHSLLSMWPVKPEIDTMVRIYSNQLRNQGRRVHIIDTSTVLSKFSIS